MPTIYERAFTLVDSGSGEASVNGLSRILTTSGLPASTIDRVRLLSLIFLLPFTFSADRQLSEYTDTRV